MSSYNGNDQGGGFNNLNLPGFDVGGDAGLGNRKPKPNIHIAHRRSPSELTTLMMEQYNLQRQLEVVQAQQKQIMQLQQFSLQQQQPGYSPKGNFNNPDLLNDFTPPQSSYKTHSRSSSINSNTGAGHRRTGSASNNPLGHSRRHSLGLHEAIKAAANQRQTNRTTAGSATNSSTNSNDSDSIGLYKFPAGSGSDNESITPPHSVGANLGHNRSRSLAYGQQSFKFPEDNSLMPPTPNFTINPSPERGHQRRSSHYKSASRNFDLNNTGNINTNWRSQQQHQRIPSLLEPPLTNFVPGHRHRNSSYGGGSISSLSQFMPNNGNNQNGRKSLFAPYLPQSSLPELINDGRLVTGVLRVNKKNRSDAYVSTDGLLDADIFICGSKDRNRALEGDLVAVELLVVDEVWDSKKEKEEKKRRKDNNYNKSPSSSLINDDIHNDATFTATAPAVENEEKPDNENEHGVMRRGSLKQRPTMKKNDDVEVEGQSLLLVEEEQINDEVKPLYAGHIVAVVDRIPGQLFAGTLGLLRPSQAAQVAKDKKNGKESSFQEPKAPKIVWFKPIDKKVPLIAIPTEQAPKDFVENHEHYADQLFLASIKRWPITSLHPFGTLISQLGKINEPETEILSILRDNNFSCDEYPEETDSESSWNPYLSDIPDVEIEMNLSGRMEYLNDYVISFTQNGSFIDHALHVKRLSNTKIELGFHVADISFYVKPGTLLDRKAKKRSSSVFLPQRSSHLYPEKVNNLASFKENERNLAFSVVFEIDTTTFEVEDLYIHESIIAPKQLVSYEEFDKIIYGKPSSNISSATSDYIQTFALIAKEFRRQRLNDRRLGIFPNLTLLSQVDDEKVHLHLNIFDETPSFAIISEISHKVNSAVATKLHASLGNEAFLRRHSLPTLQKMENVVRKAANLNIKIDTTDSASLQKSILQIDNPVKRLCVETILYKCMTRGKYYVAGKQDPDSYFHYYLNLPLYTHFNAPLRRYADLIVHRQLKSIIKRTADPRPVDLDALKATADYCNFKKDCAANAQEQAIHLLLSQTINELSGDAGQLLCMGTVLQVYESSFDVFIPELGVEKRVHGDQLPLVKAEFDKFSRVLELYWEKGVDLATYVPPDERSSLSYRSSIKNKYRTSSSEAAKIQSKTILEKNNLETITEKLLSMNLDLPQLSIPTLSKTAGIQRDANTKSMPSSPIRTDFPKNLRTNSSSIIGTDTEGNSNEVDVVGGLKPYLLNLTTRVEDGSYIQEIRELTQVPVLLRAEIGMALPCLTVRVLNPFLD